MTDAAVHARPKSVPRSTVEQVHRAMMVYCGRHGLSGEAFARRSGVSYTTLAKMHYCDASWTTIDKLRAFLDAEQAAS